MLVSFRWSDDTLTQLFWLNFLFFQKGDDLFKFNCFYFKVHLTFEIQPLSQKFHKNKKSVIKIGVQTLSLYYFI